MALEEFEVAGSIVGAYALHKQQSPELSQKLLQ